MANGNFPFGFMPLTSAAGSTGNFEMVYAPIAYDNATKIYRGDPVVRLNTGYIGQWVAAQNVGNLVGIFWGCHYLSSALGSPTFSPYWPGADVALSAQPTLYAEIIPINTGQPAKFVVQTDSTGAGFLDIGANVDVGVGTGSTVTGQSGAYVSTASTLNTTDTLPFRIVDLYGMSSFGAFGGGGVGYFPGAQVSGVAQPYSGIGATYPTTGAPGTAIPYNWVIVQGNVTSTGTGI